MNLGYLIQQAERTPSRTEQRAADAMRGELARTLSGLLHPRIHPRRGTDRPGHASSAAVTVPDYLPADWVSTPR